MSFVNDVVESKKCRIMLTRLEYAIYCDLHACETRVLGTRQQVP